MQMMIEYYPKKTGLKYLVWIFFSEFKFGRWIIGGFWIKSHLMGYKPKGCWIHVTQDGFNRFGEMPDVLAKESYGR